MNALTFESLRIALDDSGARVRIEDEIPLAVPFIKGIRMSGGFLDGQCIHFGPNLNCIIGGRGTGKSTTFEAIRCLAGQPSETTVIDSDVWPDQVDLLIESQTGQVHHLTRARSGEVGRKDTGALQALTTDEGVSIFSKADAVAVIERLSPNPVRFRLERAQIFDRPRLTVTKLVTDRAGKKHPRTREFRQLSLGQQQSVLLAIMLSADSNTPLIIDQPEDNLDGEFIYQSVVPVLRRAKERRQVIVVTHNANIAVLGDPTLRGGTECFIGEENFGGTHSSLVAAESRSLLIAATSTRPSNLRQSGRRI